MPEKFSGQITTAKFILVKFKSLLDKLRKLLMYFIQLSVATMIGYGLEANDLKFSNEKSHQ
jgi:hypothetical protein